MAFKRVSIDLLLSPIWTKCTAEIRILWITLLLLQDNTGYLEITEETLREQTKLPLEDFNYALRYLLGETTTNPPENKPPQRLIKYPDGFKIRHYIKEDKNPKKDIPLWRQNTDEGFKEYLSIVDKAYYAIEKDLEWFKWMKTIHPNILIGESLQYSYNSYWGTKAGWENKKSKKTIKIDMIKTIKNTLKYSYIYLPRGKEDYELSYICSLQAV